MDPNLEKIRDSNMHAIKRGSVQRAIQQAEDYLSHMNGFNFEQTQKELNTFVSEVKMIRRENRGKKRQGQEECI